MTGVQHYGPDTFGGVAHEGKRKDCSHPDCAWPREGDQAMGRCADGKDRAGDVVDLFGRLPVIRTHDGTEWPVERLREPEWGTYCPHGLKVVEAVPAEHSPDCGKSRPPCTLGRDDLSHVCSEPLLCLACYPEGRKVLPWSCDEPDCTEADFDRATQAEIEEYWEGINDLMHTQYE